MDNIIHKDIDAEMSIICCTLLDNSSISQVIDLDANVFYEKKHRAIWTEIINLWNDGIVINVITLSNKLEKDGWSSKIGGSYYLIQIVEKLPTSVGIVNFANILKEKYGIRKAIAFANKYSQFDNSMLFDEWLANLKREAELLNDDSKSDLVHTNELIDLYSSEDHYNSISKTQYKTGMHNFDSNVIIKRKDLIFIGGATSSGKTAFALKLAESWAYNGHKVGICSIEMPSEQIMYRRAYAKSRKSGYIGYREGLNKLVDTNIWIDESPNQSLNSITMVADKGIREKNIDILIIDYLQLMEFPKSDNVHHSLTELSRGLKLLAKKLNIPIVPLVQLRRGYEAKSRKRPLKQDLKESGSLENDADTILLTYRPFTFIDNKDCDDYRKEFNIPPESELNFFMVIVEKQRNFKVCDLPFYFIPEYQSFYEWDTYNKELQENLF